MIQAGDNLALYGGVMGRGVGENFKRNLGFLTSAEQGMLSRARTAVMGLGGVGGVAAELLARAGIGGMDICDPDLFEAGNLNRQVGALASTIGRPKAGVLAERLRDINPGLDITLHPALGLQEAQAKAMLENAACGVLAVDALAPALAAHRSARALGLPLVEALALPVVQVRVYSPQGPDPEDGLPSRGKALAEVDPRDLAQAYARQQAGLLADGGGGPLALSADFALAMTENRAAPSFGPVVWLAGSLAAMEAVKLIIGRGRPAWFPGARLDPCQWRLHLASLGDDKLGSDPVGG